MRPLPVAVAFVALLALASPLRLRAMDGYLATSSYEDVYYLPANEWLAAFSLGHREALADLIWTRMLVYYGDELGHQGGLDHIFSYGEAILALDPDFHAAYRTIGTLGIYRPQEVTAEQAERAVAIMERGVARYPDDGQLAWDTGATLAFELPHLYGDRVADADRARERGAVLMMRAEELGAAPPYAVLTSSSLLARVGRAELAANHLEQVYATTTDLELRQQLAARIASIRSDAFIDVFTEANRELADGWQREMPYAPESFYFLVGPVPVVDTTAVLRDGFAAHVLDDAPLAALDE